LSDGIWGSALGAAVTKGKALEGQRTAMRNVKYGERLSAFPLFLLEDSSWVSFPSVPGIETFSWRRNGLSGCSSCYPCTAPQGRHKLTHTVTAKKRARPISKPGRCQPQCAYGRVPFQILRSELHALVAAGSPSAGSRSSCRPQHDPAQIGGLDLARAPAPQVDRQLPGHRHDGFLARGPGRPWIA